MERLYLAFPNQNHQIAYEEYIGEWQAAGERMVPYSMLIGDGSFQDFLRMTYAYRKGEGIPPEHVPATTLFLLAEGDERILGAVNIRHTLNDYLRDRGGHIGYGVRPSERRKGYATRMLALALLECRQLGMERVLVTCDQVNIASAGTIRNNGGVLDSVGEDDGIPLERYWILL